jgi:hypothetical protein
VSFYIVGYLLKSDKKLWQSFRISKIRRYNKTSKYPRKFKIHSKFIETSCPCFTKDILPKGGGKKIQKSKFGCFQSPEMRE